MPACLSPARVAGALLAVLAVAAMPLAARAAGITVTIDPADGASVGDTVTIVARVSGAGAASVDRVSFSVDGRERSADTSVPYTFEWNTLEDTEGAHAVSAIATDSGGQTASASVRLTVENELTRGEAYLADTAAGALRDGDAERAARYARRALRLNPTSPGPASTLAAIHRQRGELDRAVETLEKAAIPDDDTRTRAQLVSLYVARGAATRDTKRLLEDAARAVGIHRELLAARLAALPADAEPVRRGDLAFAARDWEAAVRAYQRAAGSGLTTPMEAANRLLLAYARANRMKDADLLARTLVRANRADDVTQAVIAYTQLRNHQMAKARQTVQRGVDARVLPSLVVAAFADIALGNTEQARAEARQAAELAPDAPETRFLEALFVADPIDARKAMTDVLELEPTLPEPYGVLGFRALLSKARDRLALADSLFGFALAQDATGPYALLGSALSLLEQKRYQEAETRLTRLLEVDPNGPATLQAQACYLAAVDRIAESLPLLKRASEIDDRWDDAMVPEVPTLMRRAYRMEPPALLTPAVLYPAR